MAGLHTTAGPTTISVLAKHMELRERPISFTLNPMSLLWMKSCFGRRLSSLCRGPSLRWESLYSSYYYLSALSYNRFVSCFRHHVQSLISFLYVPVRIVLGAHVGFIHVFALSFLALPCQVMDAISAYRISYSRFRQGYHRGAKGEVSAVTQLMSAAHARFMPVWVSVANHELWTYTYLGCTVHFILWVNIKW